LSVLEPSVVFLMQVGVADTKAPPSGYRSEADHAARKEGDNGVSDDCAALLIVLMVSLSPSYVFLL
jgi:hypothetical protein